MESFSQIYVRCHSKLVRFASDFLPYREDAENVVQDTFVELLKNQDRLGEINNINAYLFKLVRNRCLDFIKHMVHEKAYESHAVMEYKAKEGVLEMMSDSAVLVEELQGIIRAEIENLPTRCREIFIMSRVEGLSHAKIAEKLNLAENTVSVQLGIALRRIRKRTDVYMKK